MNIIWKEVPQKYGMPVHVASINSIRLGSCRYNSLRSKSEPESYIWSCELPDINKNTGKVQSLDDAKFNLEIVINGWFSKINA